MDFNWKKGTIVRLQSPKLAGVTVKQLTNFHENTVYLEKKLALINVHQLLSLQTQQSNGLTKNAKFLMLSKGLCHGCESLVVQKVG